MQARRGRFLAGVATGAGVTAVGAVLALGSPSGATGDAGAFATSSFVRPVLAAHADQSNLIVPAGFLADGESRTIEAAGAGRYTVQRSGDVLVITDVAPAAGWTADVKWNDSDTVKAVFWGATSKLKAVAMLGDDGALATALAEEPLPVTAAPATFEGKDDDVRAAQVGGDGDRDHDGWCDDDGDGTRDGDRFEGASFDRDGDRGDWDGDHHDGDGRRHR